MPLDQNFAGRCPVGLLGCWGVTTGHSHTLVDTFLWATNAPQMVSTQHTGGALNTAGWFCGQGLCGGRRPVFAGPMFGNRLALGRSGCWLIPVGCRSAFTNGRCLSTSNKGQASGSDMTSCRGLRAQKIACGALKPLWCVVVFERGETSFIFVNLRRQYDPCGVAV